MFEHAGLAFGLLGAGLAACLAGAGSGIGTGYAGRNNKSANSHKAKPSCFFHQGFQASLRPNDKLL